MNVRSSNFGDLGIYLHQNCWEIMRLVKNVDDCVGLGKSMGQI